MNFAKAHALAKNGARIRRAIWDSYVVHTERGLHFVLPAEVAVKLGTEYEPTETDRQSCDWVLGQ